MFKILDHFYVSPPQNTSQPLSLPLTFFDTPWLLFPPSQPLFFYDFPFPYSHFKSTTLPDLTLSLSLSLQHFSLLAGNLVFLPKPNKLQLVYIKDDSVLLTVAESHGDFSHLCRNDRKDVSEFFRLVPKLASSNSCEENRKIPLLKIQVTVFPSVGICIGFAYHHVVADGRTFNNFMKLWASLCKFKDLESRDSAEFLPCYDRTVIVDPNGLQDLFLEKLWKRNSNFRQEFEMGVENMVRATFTVSSSDMGRIKKWIIAQCKKKNESLPVHLSAYVLTCAFLWVCFVKTQMGKDFNGFGDDPNYFGFIAGGMTRLGYPIPTNYFGNCIGFGFSTAMKIELIGEDGIVYAAKAIAKTIKELDRGILGRAEKWVEDLEVLFGSDHNLVVSGSPKLDIHERDFGWGRARKIEEISIDKMRAISLAESREVEGGIEVGVVFEKAKMDVFASLFVDGLRALP